MSGIIPDQGVTYRDASGNCIDQPAADNAYCPDAAFEVSCPLVALPSDCTARLDPAQINALVSELLAFAEALCPGGPWDCGSVTNLAAIWKSGCWIPDELNICEAPEVEFNTDILFVGCSDEGPVRFSYNMCDHAQDLAACVISQDEQNNLIIGSDGLLWGRKSGFFREEVPDVSTVIPLDVVGTTTTNEICSTIVNESTTENMTGMIRFTTFFNTLRLVGDGYFEYTPDLSFDGGVTWIGLANNAERRTGSSGQDTLTWKIDNRGSQSIVVPPNSSQTICFRANVNVIIPFEAESVAAIGLELGIIAGTEWPA